MTCELVALVNVTRAFWTSHSPSSPTLRDIWKKKSKNRLAHPLDTVQQNCTNSLRDWHVFQRMGAIQDGGGGNVCWLKKRKKEKSETFRSSEQMKPLFFYLVASFLIFLFLFQCVYYSIIVKNMCVCVCVGLPRKTYTGWMEMDRAEPITIIIKTDNRILTNIFPGPFAFILRR